jgi:hypothetical protein
MKKFLFFLLILSVLLFSCGENPEKYNKRAFAVIDSINEATDIFFAFASSCQSMWRSVIFDRTYIHPITGARRFCYDFNDGIKYYLEDVRPVDSLNKKKLLPQIDSLFGTIKKPPEKSQKIFDLAKEAYTINKQAYDLAFKPSGSLNSYTENINTLYRQYKELKSKVKIKKKTY